MTTMFFRRERVVEGPVVEPLVIETCWPTKKARIGGCRKKRSVQTLFHCAELQGQIEDVQGQTEDVQVQPEAVLEDVVPPEAVLLDVVPSESV
jgi:hypothetical protein